MKKLPPSAFSAEVWKEIMFAFWRHDLESLPQGSSCDGLDPLEIESTRRGVEIRARVWFLTGGNSSTNPCYELSLCLARPRFSSIESVTAEKLESAAISESVLEDGGLYVTMT